MSATNELSASRNSEAPRTVTEFTLPLTPSDPREHRRLVVACDAAIRRVVAKLKPFFGLSSALDASCSLGFHTQTLDDCDLRVCAFDAREENVAEARRRYRHLLFECASLEDRGITELGNFDFVLSFGLLHTVENPLLALRNLRTLTSKCLLLESLCLPDEQPTMHLGDPHLSNSPLSGVAWLLSEGSLVEMLYRVGFSHVYRVAPLPSHEDFRDTPDHQRRRTILLASCAPIDLAGFRLCPELHESQDPWSKATPVRPGLRVRIARFVMSPLHSKYITLALRARRLFPEMPIPLRLPFGAWWLARKGALDHELMYNGFEDAELHFVKEILRGGMTVLDVGAHHGLYTLLASKCVGRKGRVISFEPSPREFAQLSRHARINFCSNVLLEQCALADQCGEADLFLVDRFRDWGNSLRPPAVPESTHTIRVPVRTLDSVLERRGVSRVDFMKLDAEGAELAVLDGAKHMLQTAPRPAILAEVEDRRTRPWGYAAREILLRLASWNYRWFALTESGTLYPLSLDEDSYDGNFVAFPAERVGEFLRLAGAD